MHIYAHIESSMMCLYVYRIISHIEMLCTMLQHTKL